MMNLIPKIAGYVNAISGIQGMTTLAPGVIGVHDTYGKSGGEWDAYFDMTRWTVKNPEIWGDQLKINNPDMQGIGLLEGVGITCGINNFQELLVYAQRNLKPTGESLGWYAEPEMISPAEFSGLTMVRLGPIRSILRAITNSLKWW